MLKKRKTLITTILILILIQPVISQPISPQEPEPWLTIQPLPTNSYYGTSLASTDINKDGISDVLVGAPSNNTQNQGKVFIYSGKNGELLNTLTGQPGFGETIIVGDINADNIEDIIIGSPQDNKITVYDGQTLTILYTATNPIAIGKMGSSLAIIDIDGDGSKDILAGDPLNSIIVPFTGPTGTLITTSPIFGPPNTEFGRNMDTGDIDGDGNQDLLIGSIGLSAVTIYNNLPSLNNPLLLQGPPSTDYGTNLVVGDLNNDGRDEVAVSSLMTKTVYIIGSALTMISTIPGTQTIITPGVYSAGITGPPGFGESLHINDVNGDGINELLIGSPIEGKVYTYDFTRAEEGPEIYTLENSNQYGAAITTGDANGDKIKDIIISAAAGPLNQNPMINIHRNVAVEIYNSQTTPQQQTLTTTPIDPLIPAIRDINIKGIPRELTITIISTEPSDKIYNTPIPTIPALTQPIALLINPQKIIAQYTNMIDISGTSTIPQAINLNNHQQREVYIQTLYFTSTTPQTFIRASNAIKLQGR